jgi:hypothetical protein
VEALAEPDLGAFLLVRLERAVFLDIIVDKLY